MTTTKICLYAETVSTIAEKIELDNIVLSDCGEIARVVYKQRYYPRDRGCYVIGLRFSDGQEVRHIYNENASIDRIPV